jgi:hypothetical protein
VTALQTKNININILSNCLYKVGEKDIDAQMKNNFGDITLLYSLLLLVKLLLKFIFASILLSVLCFFS